MKRRTFLAILTVLAAVPASGQDQGIYEAEVPPDYAFVRVINISGVVGATGSFAGAAFTTGAAGSSGYAPVAPGSQVLVIEGGSWTIEVPTAKIVSIAYGVGEDPIVIEDEVAIDPAKATLALYNFSSADVAMSTLLKQEVEILPATPPKSAGFRAINSATIPIKIKQGQDVLAELPDQAIQRRTIVSYFVFEQGGTTTVTSQVDRTRD